VSFLFKRISRPSVFLCLAFDADVDHPRGIDANQFKAAFEDAQKTNESRKGAKEEGGDDKTKEVCPFLPSLIPLVVRQIQDELNAVWPGACTDRVKVGFYQDR
jgi:hypothetical protein